MSLPRRVLLATIFLVAIARGAAYLAYAGLSIDSPVEVYHLESKMVHLAWRVQHGRELYPDWRDYPHVTNFFGPFYFTLVGAIGRLAQVDLRGLFLTGRTVTFVACLLTSILVGACVARRTSIWAGIAAASLCASALPVYGFSIMTRPDGLAETLGYLGFVLGTGRSRGRIVWGAAICSLAIFTKQTAAIFPLAVAIALWIDGRKRPAVLFSIVVAALVGLALVVGLLVEPTFASCLLAESATGWSLAHWWVIVTRVATRGPDLLVFGPVAIAVWGFGRDREPRWAVLSTVVLVTGIVTAAKLGSDVNYLLSLRIVEGLAIGGAWRALRDSERRWGWTAVGTLGLAPLLAGSTLFVAAAMKASENDADLDSPEVSSYLQAFEEMYRIAEDPRVMLLTDWGPLALRQRDRAAFVDPWLFRTLVVGGRIEPTRVRQWLAEKRYDYIVVSGDLFSEGYRDNSMGLPPPLIDAAADRYQLRGRWVDKFVYVPVRRSSP